MRLLIALVLALFLMAPALTASATPAEERERAFTAFREGKFQEAAILFTGLLYPKNRLSEKAETAEVHFFLGISYVELGNEQAAVRELEAALALDSRLEAHPSVFSENAVKTFRRVKDEIDRRNKEAEKAELEKTVAGLVVVAKHSYFLNFVPMGAGQFQNGQIAKGAAFAASEFVTCGASVLLWNAQVIKYGWNGKVPRDEVDTVNTMQLIQISSGAVCLGLYAWQVIDSLANYEHTIERKPTKEEIDRILGSAPRSPMHITPTFGPDHAGVAFEWEF